MVWGESETLEVFGTAIWIVFIAEFVVRFTLAPEKGSTSRPTTHAEPTYIVDGIVHYCVANMPGAVPRTSTLALNNATLPFVLVLANKG